MAQEHWNSNNIEQKGKECWRGIQVVMDGSKDLSHPVPTPPSAATGLQRRSMAQCSRLELAWPCACAQLHGHITNLKISQCNRCRWGARCSHGLVGVGGRICLIVIENVEVLLGERVSVCMCEHLCMCICVCVCARAYLSIAGRVYLCL